MELDDELRRLMENLGVAINDALSESAGISDAIEAVREAGFDIFLVLEATIGLNRKHEGSVGANPGDEVQLKMNAQDMKFLKSLKIRVDDSD